jgi:hypothetical protein
MMNNLQPPPAPKKAADPIKKVRYTWSKEDREKMARQFWNVREAMYKVAPSYNPWHDPAFTGENEYANVEEVAPVHLSNISVGNANEKRSTWNPFGNLGRLPGEPPAAPKKSRRQRRQRRRATRRRMH